MYFLNKVQEQILTQDATENKINKQLNPGLQSSHYLNTFHFSRAWVIWIINGYSYFYEIISLFTYVW